MEMRATIAAVAHMVIETSAFGASGGPFHL
jgi:hypothetical protein